MRNTSRILFATILFCAPILFSGCKEKEKPGCRDLYANNYCAGCNQEQNGLCQYSGDVVFWYYDNLADSLQALGVTSLSFYINGQSAGTSPLYHPAWPMFSFNGPYCGQDSAVTFSKNWEAQRSPLFSYSIKDQNGSERFSGSVIFIAKECVRVQLSY